MRYIILTTLLSVCNQPQKWGQQMFFFYIFFQICSLFVQYMILTNNICIDIVKTVIFLVARYFRPRVVAWCRKPSHFHGTAIQTPITITRNKIYFLRFSVFFFSLIFTNKKVIFKETTVNAILLQQYLKLQ